MNALQSSENLFPLMKLLEERAPIETKKSIEEGIIEEGESLSVEDIVEQERETVSIGWGSYGTESGHPEMPKNVKVPEQDLNAIHEMMPNSDEEFTTAVVASLIGSTCSFLGISIAEAMKRAR